MIAANEGDLRLMASSSHGMRVLELIELQAREGPCLDCYTTGQPILNQNLAAADTRWPHFAPAARHAGFVTAHAFPMRIWGRPMGALNLLGIQPGGLTPTDTQAAQALADIAAIAEIASAHSPIPSPATKKSLAVRVRRVAHAPCAVHLVAARCGELAEVDSVAEGAGRLAGRLDPFHSALRDRAEGLSDAELHVADEGR